MSLVDETIVGVDKALSTDKSNFRLSSKAIFLTYPQCSVTKEDCLEYIKGILSPYKIIFIVVASESHKDGSPHLHVFLKCECQIETRNPRFFDLHRQVSVSESPNPLTVSFHPNIHSRIRSQLRVMKYVTKDGQYLSHGVDVQEFLSQAKAKRSTAPALVAHQLKEGIPLQQINEEDPEFVMMNLRNLLAYQSQLQIWERQARRKALTTNPVSVQPEIGYETPWNIAIASWLNESIRRIRPRKSKQLWLCSGPSAGKSTTILRFLRAYELQPYIWPLEEDWFDEYADGAYDFIWLDEFRSQKTIQQLNRMADGMPTSLKRRASAPFTKFDNLPLVICSNFTPEESFHNMTGTVSLASLNSRFQVIVVPPDGLIRLSFNNATASPFDQYDLAPNESRPSSPALGPPAFPELTLCDDSPADQASSQVSSSIVDSPAASSSFVVPLSPDNSLLSSDQSIDIINLPTQLFPDSRKRILRHFFETESSIKKKK